MLNPFEHPWTAVIIGLAAFMALGILRLFRSETRFPAVIVPPVLVIAAGFALDYLVATDREKILSLVQNISTAIESENADLIDGFICSDYSDSFHRDKDSLIKHCRRRFKEPLVKKNVTRVVEMGRRGRQALVTIAGRTILEEDSYAARNYKRLFFSKMRLELVKGDSGGWCIRNAELLELDRHLANWELIGHAAF
jgi:hypothetical protein